jgi:hypothetical protein
MTIIFRIRCEKCKTNNGWNIENEPKSYMDVDSAFSVQCFLCHHVTICRDLSQIEVEKILTHP